MPTAHIFLYFQGFTSTTLGLSINFAQGHAHNKNLRTSRVAQAWGRQVTSHAIYLCAMQDPHGHNVSGHCVVFGRGCDNNYGKSVINIYMNMLKQITVS